MEMLKAEQTRLGAEIMLCEERLKTLDARAEQGERVLELAITLASRCGKAYLKAKPETRRLFNQAFFEGIYVKDGQIQKAQYTELFAMLFSPHSLNKNDLVGATGFEPVTSSASRKRSPPELSARVSTTSRPPDFAHYTKSHRMSDVRSALSLLCITETILGAISGS